MKASSALRKERLKIILEVSVAPLLSAICFQSAEAYSMSETCWLLQEKYFNILISI